MWGEIAGAALGAVGGLMDKGGGQTTQTWSPYAPAASGLNSAISGLEGMPTMQAYGGNYYADMNNMMRNGLDAQYGFGQSQLPGMTNMIGQGQDFMSQGYGGMGNALDSYRRSGPAQFVYDQNMYDRTMSNIMPGLQNQATQMGIMGSRQNQSQLGQLMSAAGNVGQFGSGKASSPLANQAASASALNREATQNAIGNMYMGGSQMANNNAMASSQANMQGQQSYYNNLISGYGNLGNAGGNMFNMGLSGANNAIGNMNQAGQTQQRYDQFMTDMNRQQFMDKQTIPMNDYLSRINALSSIGGTTTATAPEKSLSQRIGSGIQGAAMGAGMGGDLMSMFGTGGGGGGMSNLFGGGPTIGNQGYQLGSTGLGNTTMGQRFQYSNPLYDQIMMNQGG